METLRKPFQGVWNIIRFNWHFYVLSLSLAIALWAFSLASTSIHLYFTLVPAITILLVTLISLLVSTYVYDISNLYSLKWLDKLNLDKPDSLVNVNAGFDETSVLLEKKYPDVELSVLDFYNPTEHTELSIKRARKAYPPYPNTLSITTNKIPLEDNSIAIVFVVLSAHEIRNHYERAIFFKELRRILKTDGKIVVTEHLRDIPNFLAYTIGFLHFHSRKTWLQTFEDANLKVSKELKITPFLTTFVLQNA